MTYYKRGTKGFRDYVLRANHISESSLLQSSIKYNKHETDDSNSQEKAFTNFITQITCIYQFHIQPPVILQQKEKDGKEIGRKVNW